MAPVEIAENVFMGMSVKVLKGVSIGADINGSDPTGATSLFVGRLDEVAIFDRALTSVEVAALAR